MNAMKKGDYDGRFIHQRMGHTETVCDGCGEVILESEDRYRITIWSRDGELNEMCVSCESCAYNWGEWHEHS